MNKLLPKWLAVTASLVFFPAISLAMPVVSGNTLNWPDDGWYQVQNADTYATVCEGGRGCDVAIGNYVVINHTTGERFEDVRVGSVPVTVNNTVTGVSTEGYESVSF